MLAQQNCKIKEYLCIPSHKALNYIHNLKLSKTEVALSLKLIEIRNEIIIRDGWRDFFHVLML